MSSVLSQKYILYAEDDPDDQLTFKEMITGADPLIDVVTTTNGLELMQYLDSIVPGTDYPCCIVLDMNMPIQDGISTLQQIRQDKQYQDIPVIMFTTSNTARDLARSQELGATAFITKPSRSSEFKHIARRFTDVCLATAKTKYPEIV